MQTQTTLIGLFVGLLLGVAAAAGGFTGFVVTAFLGGAGVVVAKVIEGDIDLAELWPNNQQRGDQ